MSASAAAALLPTAGCANAPDRSLRPISRADDLLKASQPSVNELISAAQLGGVVGVSVADLATGDVLEQNEASKGLPPASVAKALTAAYALAHLGGGYRFQTRVLTTSGVANGVVDGDLVLAGSGDPTLDTDGLAGLAKQLAAAGVREVRGGLKLWGGALPHVAEIDTAQPEHVGYNPAVSGLNLNYNRVHFEWRKTGSSYSVTMDARSASYRPDVRMARMSVEPRSAPIYTYSDAGAWDQWTVARNALGGAGARWLPVRKPELYAGEVFQSFLRAEGISVAAIEVVDRLPTNVVELARIESAALTDVLRDMLKWSTNLTAEVVGMTATAARTGRRPASLVASAKELNAWAAERLGVRGIALVDHSGLGDRSRVSAADMMAALAAIHRDIALRPLLKAFEMRDAQGRRIKNHPIDVAAKTGTLNFVSGLAGFAELPDGRTVVFAIFAADLDRRNALSVEERERPPGGAAWNRRAKTLQQKLIERWGVMYAA